ncbi:NDxxF motif lipoprotein [Siminovitchia sp. FSL H7-0308]|uniref:NDxxF motif lipoprotein n=1 Tax=unclassified Siminovitchia TaxID=2837530 RepID=UPI0030CF9E12
MVLIMRKIFYSCFMIIIFVLSGCSEEENMDAQEESATEEEISLKDIKIPSTIFTSEKNNSVIDEEEMKQSIKIYLDSDEELNNALESFEEFIWDDQTLNKSELEKFKKINKLIKENDENFSRYISNNTLPKGYQEESERISRYITTSNEYIRELSEVLDNASEGKISEKDIGSIINKTPKVSGREQKKIEDFLDEKNIDTKAFGRDVKK